MTDLPELYAKHQLYVEMLINDGDVELPQDVFEDFYDYYVSNNIMPYGVAKARSGDPYNWISERIVNDFIGIKTNGID